MPQEPKRWRVAVLVIVLFVVLVAALVLGFEGWRQNAIATETGNLKAAATRLDQDILKGRTPQRFYEDRAGGHNGQEHEDAALKLLEGLDGMSPEQRAEAGADARDPQTIMELLTSNGALEGAPPTAAEMRHLLARTKPAQVELRAAANADRIAWKPQPGDAMWDGLLVYVHRRLDLARLPASRAAALASFGDIAAASEEALLAVKFAELHTHPHNLVACMVDVGARTIAWRAAANLAIEGKLSGEVLRASWPAVTSCEALFERALEADCVSTWVFLEAEAMNKPEGWFDWGAGARQDPLMYGSPRTPVSSVVFRRQVASGMGNNLKQLSEFRSAADKARQNYTPPPADSMVAFDAASHYARIRNEFIKLHQCEAAVALRRIELQHAPGSEGSAIKALGASYEDIDISVEGGDIVIRARKAFFDGLRVDASEFPPDLRLPARK